MCTWCFPRHGHVLHTIWSMTVPHDIITRHGSLMFPTTSIYVHTACTHDMFHTTWSPHDMVNVPHDMVTAARSQKAEYRVTMSCGADYVVCNIYHVVGVSHVVHMPCGTFDHVVWTCTTMSCGHAVWAISFLNMPCGDHVVWNRYTRHGQVFPTTTPMSWDDVVWCFGFTDVSE